MSSPSYVTSLTLEARRKIFSWQLARETSISVLTRLYVELPSDPDRFLREQIVGRKAWAFHFTIGKAPHRLFFMFAVERNDETRELRVIGGRLNTEGFSYE